MQFRVLSLGDWRPDPISGARATQAARFDDLIAIAKRAEALGFAGFHLGEHHFCDYIVSNPVPLLSAIAMVTQSIQLSTGVALLANRDPVLVAEDYATLDLISKGRVELVAGRGNAFFECYRQFGQDVAQSREVFEANVDLLLALWSDGPVNWAGATRPPLIDAIVQPRPFAARPAIWIGGGSGEESIRFAASRKLDLQLPGVYAAAPSFAGLAKLYRALHPAGRIGFTAHIHVRKDGAQARDFWEPYHLAYLDWVWAMIHEGSGGGFPKMPPATAARAFADPHVSPALCGSPNEVADRLLAWNEALGGIDVMLLKFDGGAMPLIEVERAMALVAGPVAEAVRSETKARV